MYSCEQNIYNAIIGQYRRNLLLSCHNVHKCSSLLTGCMFSAFNEHSMSFLAVLVKLFDSWLGSDYPIIGLIMCEFIISGF